MRPSSATPATLHLLAVLTTFTTLTTPLNLLGALELKNSYHTLSAEEKAFRRQVNPPRNPKPRAAPPQSPPPLAVAVSAPLGAAAYAAAAAAAGGGVPQTAPLGFAPAISAGEVSISLAEMELLVSAELVSEITAEGEVHPLSSPHSSHSRCSSPGPSVSEVEAVAVSMAVPPCRQRGVHSTDPDVSDASDASDTSTAATDAAPAARVPSRLLDLSVSEGPSGGGTMVWVEGAGLDASSRVLFSGIEARVVAVASASLLKCRSPPCEMHGASSRRVVVTLVDAAPSGGGAAGAAGAEGAEGAAGAAGAEAEGLPFTYLAAKAGGVRQTVPTSAEDPADPLDPASADERPLKVRLVSVVSAIERRAAGGGGGGGDGTNEGMEVGAWAEAGPEAAAPEAAGSLLAVRDGGGLSLLHLLAALGLHVPLARLLSLPCCAPVPVDDAGRSPLAWAVARRQPLACCLLRRAQARAVPWLACWAEVAHPAQVETVAGVAAAEEDEVVVEMAAEEVETAEEEEKVAKEEEEEEAAGATVAIPTEAVSRVGRPAGGSSGAARMAEELVVAARRDLRVWQEVERRSRGAAAGAEGGQQPLAAEVASKGDAGGDVHMNKLAGGHPEGLSKRALEARLRLERMMPPAEAKPAEAEAQAHAAEAPHAKVAAAAGGAAAAMEARKAAILARLGPMSVASRSS